MVHVCVCVTVLCFIQLQPLLLVQVVSCRVQREYCQLVSWECNTYTIQCTHMHTQAHTHKHAHTSTRAHTHTHTHTHTHSHMTHTNTFHQSSCHWAQAKWLLSCCRAHCFSASVSRHRHTHTHTTHTHTCRNTVLLTTHMVQLYVCAYTTVNGRYLKVSVVFTSCFITTYSIANRSQHEDCTGYDTVGCSHCLLLCSTCRTYWWLCAILAA